jgi:predicted RNase H-like nuclease (RuvC/YqgF family)
MNNFEKDKNREEKIDKFLDTLAWYFSYKETPTGLYSKIGKIEERIDELNKQLARSSESSEKLTKALNKITLAGVIIAGLGIIVALANLGLEIYKIFFLKQ